MSYRLDLTAEDWRTIDFVGGRYAWSEALQQLCVNEDDAVFPLELQEHEAWGLAEAFESDAEGGHFPFPMLDPSSELAGKLSAFWRSIV
jgi:hypothetical protein